MSFELNQSSCVGNDEDKVVVEKLDTFENHCLLKIRRNFQELPDIPNDDSGLTAPATRVLQPFSRGMPELSVPSSKGQDVSNETRLVLHQEALKFDATELPASNVYVKEEPSDTDDDDAGFANLVIDDSIDTAADSVVKADFSEFPVPEVDNDDGIEESVTVEEEDALLQNGDMKEPLFCKEEPEKSQIFNYAAVMPKKRAARQSLKVPRTTVVASSCVAERTLPESEAALSLRRSTRRRVENKVYGDEFEVYGCAKSRKMETVVIHSPVPEGSKTKQGKASARGRGGLIRSWAPRERLTLKLFGLKKRVVGCADDDSPERDDLPLALHIRTSGVNSEVAELRARNDINEIFGMSPTTSKVESSSAEKDGTIAAGHTDNRTCANLLDSRVSALDDVASALPEQENHSPLVLKIVASSSSVAGEAGNPPKPKLKKATMQIVQRDKSTARQRRMARLASRSSSSSSSTTSSGSSFGSHFDRVTDKHRRRRANGSRLEEPAAKVVVLEKMVPKLGAAATTADVKSVSPTQQRSQSFEALHEAAELEKGTYFYNGAFYPLLNCSVDVPRCDRNSTMIGRAAGNHQPQPRTSKHERSDCVSQASTKAKNAVSKLLTEDRRSDGLKQSGGKSTPVVKAEASVNPPNNSASRPLRKAQSIHSQIEASSKRELSSSVKSVKADVSVKKKSVCATCHAELGRDAELNLSIYCGDTCIEKMADKMKRSISNPAAKVTVIDCTGRVLDNDSAPTLRMLSIWLKRNRLFQPVIPKTVQKSEADSTQSTEPGDASADQPSVSHTSSADDMRRRIKFRRDILEVLSTRAKDADDLLLSTDEIKKLAVSIEIALFNAYKGIGPAYREQFKAIYLQLKNPSNKGLFRRILLGELSASKLAVMSASDLLCKQYALWQEPAKAVETKPAKRKLVRSSLSVPAADPLTTLLGLVVDTTAAHKSHLFDHNCRICTSEQHPSIRSSDCQSKDTAVASTDHESASQSETPQATLSDYFETKQSTFAIPSAEKTADALPPPSVSPAIHVDPVFAPIPYTRDPLNLGADDEGCGSLSTSFSKMQDAMFMGYGGCPPPPPPAPPRKKPSVYLVEQMESPKPSVPSPSEVAARSVSVGGGSAAVHLVPTLGFPECLTFTNRKPQALLWTGCVSMQDVVHFETAAYHVCGPHHHPSSEFPKTFNIVGRIEPDVVWKYLREVRKSSVKDFVVLKFLEANHSVEDRRQYHALYENMRLRNRYCVVSPVSKNLKDFYILPLAAHESMPSELLPLDETCSGGLEDNRRNLLLGVFVRSRSGASVSVSGYSSSSSITERRHSSANPVNIPLSPSATGLGTGEEALTPFAYSQPSSFAAAELRSDDASQRKIAELIRSIVIDDPSVALQTITAALGGQVTAEQHALIVAELQRRIEDRQKAILAEAAADMDDMAMNLLEAAIQPRPGTSVEYASRGQVTGSESVQISSDVAVVQNQFMELMQQMMSVMSATVSGSANEHPGF